MLHELSVAEEAAGQRLDVWLEQALPGCSRSLVARLIKEDRCRIDPGRAKPGYRLRGGERVLMEVPEVAPLEAVAEDIPLTILHEDERLIVIDKPAGMVVHPAVGHLRGTMVNALLGRYGDRLPGGIAWRPGIVHRLDAETSGVICVAKDPATLDFLQDAFRARTVRKRYLALVHGHPTADYFVAEEAIGRHARDFRRRAVVAAERADAKSARTAFVVRHRGEGYTVLEARPRTGRTHQIRVHCAHHRHPILADALYGGGRRLPAHFDLPPLQRHALHAWSLDIPHPTGGRLLIEAPIAADLLPYVPEAARRIADDDPRTVDDSD